MFDEQIDKIRETAPNFRVALQQPIPCCDLCKNLSTDEQRDFVCNKHGAVRFNYLDDPLNYNQTFHFVCDDFVHRQEEEKPKKVFDSGYWLPWDNMGYEDELCK